MDGVQSRYAEIPADIGKRLQEVQQRVEEVTRFFGAQINQSKQKKISNFCLIVCARALQLVKGSDPVRKLAGRVVELGSGLQKVTALLEQKSPTVGEAQNVLKVCRV